MATDVNLTQIEGQDATDTLKDVVKEAIEEEEKIFVQVRPFDSATGLRKE